MNRASNIRSLLTLLTVLLAFSAAPVSASSTTPAPQYRVLLCRGTLGGSATGQWAATQVAYPNPRAAGIVGYYLNVQEVPGLTVSWSTPGATPIQVAEWNPNPKERTLRAVFRYTTPGIYTALCTLTYDCLGGGTASVDIPFQIFVF